MGAPRGSADFEESDELQRLRRRAYGPDADIAGDAAAQARLAELEAAQGRERAPAAAALPVAASERALVPEPLEGSRPAQTTSMPQPVQGASAEAEAHGGSITGPDPAGIPTAGAKPMDRAHSTPWWRRRGLLPWVIAAVVVLAAAIGIGVFVNESNQPEPVARLTPQGQPGSASIPVDDDVPVRYDLTVADFVSYGSYGPLQIWSTTKLENQRCIAVVVQSHISVFECTAPSVDTIADYNIDPNLIPPAPSGELTPYVRFVLHDEVVDVYRPTEEGEFYGSAPRERQTPQRQAIVTADYRFENSLADSVRAATALSAIGAYAIEFIDEAVQTGRDTYPQPQRRSRNRV